MFRTLLIKEIQDAVNDFRILITMILCVILIPTGIYLASQEYVRKNQTYQQEQQAYYESNQGKIHGGFQAEGYRPPSPLSVFALGLEDFFPKNSRLSNNYSFSYERIPDVSEPLSTLFGKIDFIFAVSFVLSILALIFTFNAVSGEKEACTLRLVLANSVPRWQILLAKLFGRYLIFIVPFLTGIFLGLIVVQLSGNINLFITNILFSTLVIIGSSLLFLFIIFNLGILISVLTKQSITSLILQLFCWAFFFLIIPKVSPMIAEVIQPIKSRQIVNKEKDTIRQDLKNELNRKSSDLLKEIMNQNGVEFDNNLMTVWQSEAGSRAIKEYDKNEDKIQMEKEYEEKINSALGKIEQEYKTQLTRQQLLTMNFSRLSPLSCFTYLVTDLAATGPEEMNSFDKNSQKFLEFVKQEIYDDFYFKRYSWYGSYWGFDMKKEGTEDKKHDVPVMRDYRHTTLNQALKANWIDLVLLVFYGILFFAGSFVGFLRYDVR